MKLFLEMINHFGNTTLVLLFTHYQGLCSFLFCSCLGDKISILIGQSTPPLNEHLKQSTNSKDKN